METVTEKIPLYEVEPTVKIPRYKVEMKDERIYANFQEKMDEFMKLHHDYAPVEWESPDSVIDNCKSMLDICNLATTKMENVIGDVVKFSGTEYDVVLNELGKKVFSEVKDVAIQAGFLVDMERDVIVRICKLYLVHA